MFHATTSAYQMLTTPSVNDTRWGERLRNTSNATTMRQAALSNQACAAVSTIPCISGFDSEPPRSSTARVVTRSAMLSPISQASSAWHRSHASSRGTVRGCRRGAGAGRVCTPQTYHLSDIEKHRNEVVRHRNDAGVRPTRCGRAVRRRSPASATRRPDVSLDRLPGGGSLVVLHPSVVDAIPLDVRVAGGVPLRLTCGTR